MGGAARRGFLLAAIAFVLAVAAPLASGDPQRTWEFELKTAATYKLQVEHQMAQPAPGAKVSYKISIGEEAQTRELDLIANRPFSPLLVDVPAPRKMRVVVGGLNQIALDNTRMYVYDELSLPALEIFDPAKHALSEVDRIRLILEQPETKIDLARTMLTIDKLIDPSIDIEANLAKIASMAKEVEAMPEYGVQKVSNLLALKRYVYEAGEWNGLRKFEYDLDDPLGHNMKNKLLSSYLSSRKGNCVTMPLLFVILGQRLGLDITLSTAPRHLFVKFRNDFGTWINLEATSGANPARDVWLRSQFPSMTDAAVANGVYLRPLAKRETAAVMAMVLAEYYLQESMYRKAVAISDLVLEYYSKGVEAMVLKGSAYARIAKSEFHSKYLTPADIPSYLRSYFANLGRRNVLAFEKAEALGWREESKDEREEYLRTIDEVRNQRKAH